MGAYAACFWSWITSTVGAVDRDRTRLLGLGDLAHEVDVQETVLEVRALDLDKVGELEHALESARCDALIEHVAALLLLLGVFLAADGQRVLLRYDRKFGLVEARDRHARRDKRFRRSARYCRADNRERRRRCPGRAARTAGRSRRWNDKGELDRKFAWHILLVKRHADGSPGWAKPDECAARKWPAQYSIWDRP